MVLLAPWGIDPELGAMNNFIHGAEIARAMVRNSVKPSYWPIIPKSARSPVLCSAPSGKFYI